MLHGVLSAANEWLSWPQKHAVGLEPEKREDEQTKNGEEIMEEWTDDKIMGQSQYHQNRFVTDCLKRELLVGISWALSCKNFMKMSN